MSTLMARWMNKITVGDDCWEWQGALSQGYGRIQPLGGATSQLAHRVGYELLVGPIPEGLTLDHLCRNRKCVNPGHLEAVSLQENLRRGFWGTKVTCAQGHEYVDGSFIIEMTTRRSPRGLRRCLICRREYDRKRRPTHGGQG